MLGRMFEERLKGSAADAPAVRAGALLLGAFQFSFTYQQLASLPAWHLRQLQSKLYLKFPHRSTRVVS
jgi:hypothetical protein